MPGCEVGVCVWWWWFGGGGAAVHIGTGATCMHMPGML